MTVAELKSQLQSRGLITSGRKDELLDRLLKAVETTSTATGQTTKKTARVVCPKCSQSMNITYNVDMAGKKTVISCVGKGCGELQNLDRSRG